MKDNDSICVLLMAIFAVLLIMAMNQCSTFDKMHGDLRDISYELRQLKYK